MRSGKILVVGATGRVGGAAVELLLEAGFEVRALVR
ncbi:MAG: NmrA family NAD(P)-binding protein, partial [Actinomycetota bacterium]|nr:NmrA family NAD(P)-binding protein [Actinomycetota bacterium]